MTKIRSFTFMLQSVGISKALCTSMKALDSKNDSFRLIISRFLKMIVTPEWNENLIIV